MGGAPSAARAALLGLVAVALAAGACGSSRPAAEAPLGERPLPAFLPKSPPADRALRATASRPALAFQGEAVVADLPGAAVSVSVVGPAIPAVAPGAPQPALLDCTWSVTLSAATAPVTVGAGQWSVRSSTGVTRPLAPAPGSAPLPATVTPGSTLRLRLAAMEPVGEGLVVWSPTPATPIASWDYVAEVN